MRKFLLVLLAISSAGFCLAMGLSFAGGWVAPAARIIEWIGLVSVIVVVVCTVGIAVIGRKSNLSGKTNDSAT